ncbi:MAG: DNA-binding protein [Nevskiales bacterium]
MSLENLAKIGRLRPHTTDRVELGKLLGGAQRSIKDAENTSISNATRFTSAYTAIMEAAQAALFANGYRPDIAQGGHHMTMVQALVHTIGLDGARVKVLDAFRRKRHVIDYSGEDADPSEVRDTTAAAKALLADVRAWIAKNRPELA